MEVSTFQLPAAAASALEAGASDSGAVDVAGSDAVASRLAAPTGGGASSRRKRYEKPYAPPATRAASRRAPTTRNAVRGRREGVAVTGMGLLDEFGKCAQSRRRFLDGPWSFLRRREG
jgi:hypothetical protein